MKHNIDDILIAIPADQGYQTVCFTDAKEEDAMDYFEELDYIQQGNALLHLHAKLLELMQLLETDEQALFYRKVLIGVVEEYGINTEIDIEEQ